MKTATYNQWHAWDNGNPYHPAVLLSDERNKTLRSFPNWDDLISWLFINGHKDAARSFNRTIKG